MTYEVKEIRNKTNNELMKITFEDINICIEGYYDPENKSVDALIICTSIKC